LLLQPWLVAPCFTQTLEAMRPRAIQWIQALAPLKPPRVGTNLQIIGEVVNFAEDGGECIITFYSGNTPIVMERVPAEHNVSTTQCYPLTTALSRLPKGMVDVVIGYESAKYAGESEKLQVIIP